MICLIRADLSDWCPANVQVLFHKGQFLYMAGEFCFNWTSAYLKPGSSLREREYTHALLLGFDVCFSTRLHLGLPSSSISSVVSFVVSVVTLCWTYYV